MYKFLFDNQTSNYAHKKVLKKVGKIPQTIVSISEKNLFNVRIYEGWEEQNLGKAPAFAACFKF